MVQSLSLVWLFVTPWTAAHQASLFFTVSQSLLKFISFESVILSNDLIFCHPPYPFGFNLSQHQCLFQWVGSSHQVAKVLELQLQQQSFQWKFRDDFLYDWLVWSPYRIRDSQESSTAPHFKGINSLALSFLYGPTLTSIHYYWKTVSLTIQSFIDKVTSLLLNTLSRFVIVILTGSKQATFNFMAAVNICNDFWNPRKENLSQFQLLLHLFAMKLWDQMQWS